MIEILSVLAIWCITDMLMNRSGPFHIFGWIREQSFTVKNVLVAPTPGKSAVEFQAVRVPTNFVGELLECVYCTSTWVSFLFAVQLTYRDDWLLLPTYWFGLAGAAILLELARRRYLP